MPKYYVSAAVVGSKFLGIFEAKDRQEAGRLAEASNECYVSLCHQCSSECEDAEVGDIFVELCEEE